MSILTQQYQNKQQEFNISSTRKKKIIDLAGEIRDKKILDVGCATGYLGEYFKQQGNYVVGLDISQEDIMEAKKKLDEVLLVDLESDDWLELLLELKFDLIIVSEVVEHLLYPENLLAKLARLLNDEGEIIITTPNFLVWTNRLKMLFGKFGYQQSGFWGRDHIHFFSWPEFKKLVHHAGFNICKRNHLRHPRVPDFLAKIWPAMFAFQLIIKIKK